MISNDEFNESEMGMVCPITQEPITRMRLHYIADEYRYKKTRRCRS
ncbi:hypothetical protein ACQ5T4_04455 [Vibrio cholerae]